MAVQEWVWMQVLIDSVDFTEYLRDAEQIITIPAGSEIGRATLSFIDDGTLPAIAKWASVIVKGGVSAPGTTIWGGYATRQTAEPMSIGGGSRLVTVDCQSYSIILSATEPITRTYGGGEYPSITNDHAIVADLVADYLPGFSTSISTDDPVDCEYIQFSEETLRSALNKIVERSGKEYGIKADKTFYYRPAGSAGTLSHGLSDSPDYVSTWPMREKPFDDRDDVDVRNAIKVVGGWTLSQTQVETFSTDGIEYEFQVTYFPRSIDSVTLDDVVLSVGLYLVDDPADFDVLVHYDRQLFIFQLPPATGKTLAVTYRYPIRIEYTATDAASITEIGKTLWGPSIVDGSISSSTVAQQAATIYLARSTQSIERGQLTTTWVGATPYLPEYSLTVTASSLGWDEKVLSIQTVTIRFVSRPGGTGVCLAYWDITVGTQISVGQSLGGSFADGPSVSPETYAPAIRQRLATEVFANQGTIGGWTIATGHLFTGTGASRAGLHPADYPFYAGSETRASAPFRVTPAGALTATSATITGVITASSGSIAGWTISSGELYSEAGGHPVGLKPATYPFYAGNADSSAAPFRVTASGSLVASSAIITGAIPASSGCFTGFLTLGSDGGIYQGSGTAASPTTGLKIWNDGGTGRIAGYNGSTIQWYANTDGKLYAGGGKVRIDAGGITFLGAGSSPDGATLTWLSADGNTTWGQTWAYASQLLTKHQSSDWAINMLVAEDTGSGGKLATMALQSTGGYATWSVDFGDSSYPVLADDTELYHDERLRSKLFALVDGITAPSTASGYALIYVDTSDGDLKVKFGDGTVKTIATDS